MEEFKLPKGWEEIPLSQFNELKKLDEDDSSFFVRHIDMFSILTDSDPTDEYWEDMDIEDVSAIITSLKWLEISPTSILQQELNGMTLKDIKTITFGEFIDLEYFFSDNYYNNLDKIAAILYRKTKLDEWGNIALEPYGSIDLESRSKLFSEMPITNLYGLISYFLNFKSQINETYVNLFEPIINEEDLDEEEIYDEETQDVIKEEIRLSKWSWETVLNNLSNGDITKYEDITNLSIIFIMNQLSYRKDMNIK